MSAWQLFSYAYSPMVFAAEIQELEGLRTANTRTWVPIVEQEDGFWGPIPVLAIPNSPVDSTGILQSGDEPIWLRARPKR